MRKLETQIKNKKKAPYFLRFKEHNSVNEKLNAVTLFPYINIHSQGKYYRTVLNFSFKDLEFNKKKVLPFFLAMELLTNQKCIATLSSKNILFWKLRKGMLVGCKVTLRKENLFDFFDNLLLASARMERYFPKTMSEVVNEQKGTQFYLLKLSELLFFYPIELGLGVNSDVKRVELNFIFNTWAFEEKIFMLTSKKIPLLIKR